MIHLVRHTSLRGNPSSGFVNVTNFCQIGPRWRREIDVDLSHSRASVVSTLIGSVMVPPNFLHTTIVGSAPVGINGRHGVSIFGIVTCVGGGFFFWLIRSPGARSFGETAEAIVIAYEALSDVSISARSACEESEQSESHGVLSRNSIDHLRLALGLAAKIPHIVRGAAMTIEALADRRILDAEFVGKDHAQFV